MRSHIVVTQNITIIMIQNEGIEDNNSNILYMV